jgi:excisionase family DNA binding protein
MSVLDPPRTVLPETRKVPALLTTPEVAEVLRVSPRTIDRWAAEGRLRRFHLAPGSVRYRADDILALLDNDHEPAANGLVGKAGTTDAHPAV